MSTPASDRAAPLTSIGERALVAFIRTRFPANPSLLPVGIGDDAAVALPVRGELEVLTTDALVEGVHFDLQFSSLVDVGYKAIAVNLSDVAAMGAKPLLALLSLILPADFTVGRLSDLLDGVAAATAENGVAVAGGNMTRSPGPLVVDVTLTGSVGRRKFLSRGGGRPGDALYVTGTVGSAAAGLGWLRQFGRDPTVLPEDPGLALCVGRYRRPEPRTRFGLLLGRTRTASACMDLSDGLADAVTQLAESSGSGAVIRADTLPVASAAADWFTGRSQDPLKASLAGGDDYELLFSVSARHKGRLKTVLQQARGIRVSRIGELTADPSIRMLRNGLPEPLPEGFSHF